VRSPRSASPVLRWHASAGWRPDVDEVAAEEPLEIRLGQRPLSVTMRTPGHDEELAVGFLVSEGVVRTRADLLAEAPLVRLPLGNAVEVRLADAAAVDFGSLTRHVFASSSCGICGKATIAAVRRQFPRVDADFRVAEGVLQALPEALRAAQETFERTGGLHAAGVFTLDGAAVVVREDVGRHNAVDKVIGWGLLNDRLPFDRHVLVVSGRTSFEVLQKALSAGVAVVAAVSAPSSLAVELARSSGQTLVGFLRPGRMNVYAHPHRVTASRPTPLEPSPAEPSRETGTPAR
jgi:FdhD protein